MDLSSQLECKAVKVTLEIEDSDIRQIGVWLLNADIKGREAMEFTRIMQSLHRPLRPKPAPERRSENDKE